MARMSSDNRQTSSHYYQPTHSKTDILSWKEKLAISAFLVIIGGLVALAIYFFGWFWPLTIIISLIGFIVVSCALN